MNNALKIVSVSFIVAIIGAVIIDLTSLRVTGITLIVIGIFLGISGPLLSTLDE